MRNKYFLVLACIIGIGTTGRSQSYSDDFESYTAGNYLAQSTFYWRTWSNSPGGADDIKVSNAKAKSGNNSLKFASTLSPGGPADIILPFSAAYSDGNFTLSLWMFVDAGKKAYWNLQEQTTVGKGWSVDMNFDSLGMLNMVNTLSGKIASVPYTQNQWIKVELKLDLSNNNWELLMDNVSKVVFQNSYRAVASLDIYPTTGCSFYIDDVSYTYTPFIKPVFDASLTFIDKMQGVLAGLTVMPLVEIRNLGTGTINSLSVELTYKGNTQTKNISGLSIASMATYTIAMDNPVVMTACSAQATATILLVNGVADTIVYNNARSITINPAVPALNKLVIAEEATGTWCTWCPRGHVWMKNMDEKYPGRIQGIAVHNNDTMANLNYDKGLSNISSGYPSVVVDRGADLDPSGMEPDVLARMQIPPKAVIRNGAQYNSSTRELKVSLTTRFLQAASGDYKVACVLVEDSVTGTGTKFNQVNSYANNANGPMGGFELLPNPVPASKMVYEHVARVISPTWSGVKNAFGASMNVGDSFTHNFSFTLYEAWRPGKIKIVGMVIEPGGKIDNGSAATISQAEANGYTSGTFISAVENVSVPEKAFVIFPNPSTGIFHFAWDGSDQGRAEVSVFNMQGQRVYSAVSEGGQLKVDGENWQRGIYFAQVKCDGGTYSSRLVKE